MVERIKLLRENPDPKDKSSRWIKPEALPKIENVPSDLQDLALYLHYKLEKKEEERTKEIILAQLSDEDRFDTELRAEDQAKKEKWTPEQLRRVVQHLYDRGSIEDKIENMTQLIIALRNAFEQLKTGDLATAAGILVALYADVQREEREAGAEGVSSAVGLSTSEQLASEKVAIREYLTRLSKKLGINLLDRITEA